MSAAPVPQAEMGLEADQPCERQASRSDPPRLFQGWQGVDCRHFQRQPRAETLGVFTYPTDWRGECSTSGGHQQVCSQTRLLWSYDQMAPCVSRARRQETDGAAGILAIVRDRSVWLFCVSQGEILTDGNHEGARITSPTSGGACASSGRMIEAGPASPARSSSARSVSSTGEISIGDKPTESLGLSAEVEFADTVYPGHAFDWFEPEANEPTQEIQSR